MYIIILLIGMSFSTNGFDIGFQDGWCDGYQDSEACGQYAICPIAPIPPIPGIDQDNDSYIDGYGEGFKAGFRKGKKDCSK